MLAAPEGHLLYLIRRLDPCCRHRNTHCGGARKYPGSQSHCLFYLPATRHGTHTCSGLAYHSLSSLTTTTALSLITYYYSITETVRRGKRREPERCRGAPGTNSCCVPQCNWVFARLANGDQAKVLVSPLQSPKEHVDSWQRLVLLCL